MTDKFPALPQTGTGFARFRLLGELEVEARFQESAAFQGGERLSCDRAGAGLRPVGVRAGAERGRTRG